MNWNDALTAVQDGSYLKWETGRLQEGITALHKQSSTDNALYYNGIISTIQTEIKSRETSERHGQLLVELGEQTKATAKGVCWAKTAAWAAIVIAAITVIAFICSLFEKH